MYPAGNSIRHIQALLNEHRFDEAEVLCNQLCARQPGNGIAWGLRGALYNARGITEQAVESYRTACRLVPDNAALQCNLGHALQATGRYAEAVEHYEQALRIQPGLLQVEVNLGYALSALDRLDEAMTHYQNARGIDPQFEPAIAGVADILEKTGAQQEAADLILPRIAAGTGNADVLCLYAALGRDLELHVPSLRVLEQALTRHPFSRIDRAKLHFQAGRLYDDLACFDQAFAHYDRGNRLVGCHYDAEGDEQQTSEAIRTFSASSYAAMPVAANDSPRPIFIIGMPRSGTSLVEQILASHPVVFGGGELPWIHEMTLGLAGTIGTTHGYPACCRAMTADIANRLAGRYLESIDTLARDELRVTDKTPHNFLHLGLITRLFPRATVIHCTRNPLDTCLSCYFRLFSRGNEYSYDLRMLGRHYQQYQRLMRHWRDTLGIPMFEVNYESLIEDQGSASRALLEYCRLSWDEQCLRFYSKQRKRLSPSYDDVRRPIYSRSVGRWRNYAAHLGPLREAISQQSSGEHGRQPI